MVAHRYRFRLTSGRFTGSILGGGTHNLLQWFGPFLFKPSKQPNWKFLCAFIQEKTQQKCTERHVNPVFGLREPKNGYYR